MINWDEVQTPLTPEEIQAAADSQDAHVYLTSTHWYVTRLVELGEPIPDDVKQRRAEAYAAIIPEE